VILMDSSGWVEIVRGGPRQQAFRDLIEQAEAVLVPTLVLYEVYRVIERQFDEAQAERIISYLRSHAVVDLTDELAVAAARAGKQHGLATADAVVYATASVLGARLVTGDVHFADLPDVAYVPVAARPAI
jgi:uncharacterized protein